MSLLPNTLFLRLEGPLQSWGDASKFVIRRTMEAPTKSGVIGLICCAMGLSRQAAREELQGLGRLAMGVRIDRPGVRWWDYHTVGAAVGLRTAEGKVKEDAKGTLITRREYLADASFLVALLGDATLIERASLALKSPKWPLYLGRKSCPPAVPVFAGEGTFLDLEASLASVSWRARIKSGPDEPPEGKRRQYVLDVVGGADARDATEVWYDVPVSFDPPAHQARLVRRVSLCVTIGDPIREGTPPPVRPRANYSNAEWTSETIVDVVNPTTGKVTREPRGARPRRLCRDHGLCVFCKSPASTVQHVTYRRAGGNEAQEDLRALCRLCHDAVTMIEYGRNMGMDRINPEDSQYRDAIIRKRDEIIRFRSLETRRRRLAAEEVE